jgi:hypothetical protein
MRDTGCAMPHALVETALGLALADWIVDLLVPADLRSMITAQNFQPAVAVVAVMHVVVGTIIAASIV